MNHLLRELSEIVKPTKQVFLTIEKFNKDLQECLTIITEPTEFFPYYVCEYISPALYKSIVHIYITK
jgi:hypothetical protein